MDDQKRMYSEATKNVCSGEQNIPGLSSRQRHEKNKLVAEMKEQNQKEHRESDMRQKERGKIIKRPLNNKQDIVMVLATRIDDKDLIDD